MDRGLLDAAEFNNPSSDFLLGFADVSKFYMVQSYHQSAESFEIIFNKRKYDALPAELRAIIKYASEAASSDMIWKALDRYSKDLEELKKKGVNVVKTPDSVLDAQLKAWDKVIEAQSKEAFFAKVIASQKEWAKRTLAYERANNVSGDMAYKHFFG